MGLSALHIDESWTMHTHLCVRAYAHRSLCKKAQSSHCRYMCVQWVGMYMCVRGVCAQTSTQAHMYKGVCMNACGMCVCGVCVEVCGWFRW